MPSDNEHVSRDCGGSARARYIAADNQARRYLQYRSEGHRSLYYRARTFTFTRAYGGKFISPTMALEVPTVTIQYLKDCLKHSLGPLPRLVIKHPEGPEKRMTIPKKDADLRRLIRMHLDRKVSLTSCDQLLDDNLVQFDGWPCHPTAQKPPTIQPSRKMRCRKETAERLKSNIRLLLPAYPEEECQSVELRFKDMVDWDPWDTKMRCQYSVALWHCCKVCLRLPLHPGDVCKSESDPRHTMVDRNSWCPFDHYNVPEPKLTRRQWQQIDDECYALATPEMIAHFSQANGRLVGLMGAVERIVRPCTGFDIDGVIGNLSWVVAQDKVTMHVSKDQGLADLSRIRISTYEPFRVRPGRSVKSAPKDKTGYIHAAVIVCHKRRSDVKRLWYLCVQANLQLLFKLNGKVYELCNFEFKDKTKNSNKIKMQYLRNLCVNHGAGIRSALLSKFDGEMPQKTRDSFYIRDRDAKHATTTEVAVAPKTQARLSAVAITRIQRFKHASFNSPQTNTAEMDMDLYHWTSVSPSVHEYFRATNSRQWNFNGFLSTLKPPEKHDATTTWNTNLNAIKRDEWTPLCIVERCESHIIKNDSRGDSGNQSDGSDEDVNEQGKRAKKQQLVELKKQAFDQAKCRNRPLRLDLSNACLESAKEPGLPQEVAAADQPRKSHEMVTRGATDKKSVHVPLVDWKVIDTFPSTDGFPEPIKAELESAIQRIQLQRDFAGEILEVANIFRSSSSVILGHLLDEFYGKLRIRGQVGRQYKELRYVWRVMDDFLEFWDIYPEEPLEGWLTAYLYGPLLAILLGANPELKMSDIDGTYHRPEGLGPGFPQRLRHDAILRYNVEPFGWDLKFLDIMVMEAKPSKSQGPGPSVKEHLDYIKLRDAMCGNLRVMEQMVHSDSHPQLRTYGVQFRDCHTTLLEARIVAAHTYIVFPIDEFIIPSKAKTSLPNGVPLKMILFARRIQETTSFLQDCVYKESVAPTVTATTRATATAAATATTWTYQQ
ncbi:MAG: hypothetical protein J3Q66DRAFT_431098 [Benniella sp.]|nr:MAG: hypothetical protein J3Q66DRAFT_431098 [Benniella sp.]